MVRYLLALLLCTTTALAQDYHVETVQVEKIVASGQLGENFKASETKIEHRLFDGTRVDILSPLYAVEVDWADKWAEGIGQALYYAHVTKRKPCLILLIKNRTDDKAFMYRALITGEHTNVKVVFVDAYKKEE